MIIYLLSFFSCYLLGISKQRLNHRYELVLFIFLTLFLCTGFMCGSDWRNYETMYEAIDWDNYGYDYYAEPGFYAFMAIFKFLNVDFWHLTVLIKILCFIVFLRFLKKHLQENVLLGLMYFVPWYGFYLFIDCPMRNLMAIAIFILALPYLVDRDFLRYFLLIVLASTFHLTAFLFLFLYFSADKKQSNTLWIGLFVVVNIFFASRTFIIWFSSFLFGGIPIIAAKIDAYFSEENVFAEGRIFSVGMLIHLVFFVLLLIKRKSIEGKENGILVFNLAILYLLFYRLAVTIEVFMRFQLYLAPCFCIALIRVAQAFAFKTRILYITYLLCIASIGSLKIFADYRYIPYTSYIPYFFEGEYPSFEYRSEYNHMYSPYEYKTNY